MRATILQSTLFLAGSLLALPVLAGQRVEYGQVVRVDPIIEVVRISEPRTVCWDEAVTHRAASNRSRTPDVLGAVIGGAVGNQFGSGSGRTAMTVAGAALGASIGRDYSRATHPGGSRYYTTVEQRCRTEHGFREEERIRGYDVTYRHRGELHRTRTSTHPGDRIPLQVSVRPLHH